VGDFIENFWSKKYLVSLRILSNTDPKADQQWFPQHKETPKKTVSSSEKINQLNF